ncbi:transposase [Microbulbifer sp. VAAF005]|uniref:transposase n=1 Tax=Microbulbifer sp. VAAF005 TaxID=3034230 RepID=UPI0024AE0C49|nr:transposase [Microbulbifer sp. VAAF005]WHI47264.1 transposase [Microbulbifer sp. VAAF005]
MTLPRSAQISLDTTPYYHCVSRCVRRAFLCGRDTESGKDYEHRREWIESRMYKLDEVFALDIAAYAVMSNHYHIVLYIDTESANKWSIPEVITRWQKLFKASSLAQRYLQGDALDHCEVTKLKEVVSQWRERLMDISWFMRCLNESIARQANAEDQCTGRFWEGRFKSQALLDERALAACMAYVDLNPIRANIAKTPEESDYTSIQQRIRTAVSGKQPKNLLPFVGSDRLNMPKGLPFQLDHYLELVDWSGRHLDPRKRGCITENTPPILERLSISPKHWRYLNRNFESRFKGLVGSVEAVKQTCIQLDKRWVHGIADCRRFLSATPF